MVSDAKIECPNCKSIVRKDGFSKHKKSKKCIKATNSKKVEVVEKKEIKPKVVEKVVVVEPKLEEEIEMNSIINTDKKQFEYLLTYKLNVFEMDAIIYNLDERIEDYLKQEIPNNTELEALCKLHKLLKTEQNIILKKMKEEPLLTNPLNTNWNN